MSDVGVGIRRVNAPLRTGILADGFVSVPIVVHTALTVRYHTGINGYTAVFAGIGIVAEARRRSRADEMGAMAYSRAHRSPHTPGLPTQPATR